MEIAGIKLKLEIRELTCIFAMELTIDGNTGAHVVILLTEHALSWHIFIKSYGAKVI